MYILTGDHSLVRDELHRYAAFRHGGGILYHMEGMPVVVRNHRIAFPVRHNRQTGDAHIPAHWRNLVVTHRFAVRNHIQTFCFNSVFDQEVVHVVL